jgi:predicted DNA binding CopG/RHH family protein
MKSRKNPYVKRLKKQITIRVGTDTIEYFKDMAEQTGVPYQNLIDSYLADCAAKQRKLQMKWA